MIILAESKPDTIKHDRSLFKGFIYVFPRNIWNYLNHVHKTDSEFQPVHFPLNLTVLHTEEKRIMSWSYPSETSENISNWSKLNSSFLLNC